MRRHGGLWDEIGSWTNLVRAARRAQRAKRDRGVVQKFNFAQERELIRIQRELILRTWTPGPFRSHWITRPKRRLISAAPYADRVVHHALMNVLEPVLERHFHPHSYACRRGKGTHAAVGRLQALMGRYKYALQCDVKKFFPSIDHEISSNVRAFRRRVRWMRRAYRAGKIDVEQIKPRLASWLGHARQADSERLIRRIGRDWTFVRGRANSVACLAGRRVEQQSTELPLCVPQQEHARQPEQQYRVPVLPALSRA